MQLIPKWTAFSIYVYVENLKNHTQFQTNYRQNCECSVVEGAVGLR